jgi:hypothetical protein
MAPLNELIAKYDPSVLNQYAESSGGTVVYGSSGSAVAEPTEASEAAEEEPAEEPSTAATAPEESPEPGDAEETGEPEEEFEQPPPYLIVGDTDHTEAYVKCLKTTGFTQPEYKPDPKEELKEKQRTLEATTDWLTCARENGYPNLKDPPAPKADEYQTQPMALLPADITEAELRALLATCPNFDAEDMAAGAKEAENLFTDDMGYTESMKLYDELIEKYPGMIQPSLGFDAPGFNGDWSTVTEETMEGPDYERLSKLQMVLQEPIDEFYNTQYGEG